MQAHDWQLGGASPRETHKGQIPTPGLQVQEEDESWSGDIRVTYLMHLIHSSFSSGVGAEIRYTVWFPSTTRPSASVLQALITWSLLSGM